MRLPRFGLLAAAIACSLAFAAVGAPSAHASGVTADVAARVQGSYKGSNGLGSPAFSFSQVPLFQLSPGTGAGQADLMFADSRTLSASSTENLDLAGALTDPLGATLTFAHVKAIYVRAKATNTNNVVVGGAASNAFTGPLGGTTPTVTLPPGGVLLVTFPGAGWTVTASTGDLLKIANSGSGSSVLYDVIIIGTST